MTRPTTRDGRVTITYSTQAGGQTVAKELPLRLLVLGAFSGNHSSVPVGERTPVGVTTANFDTVLKNLGISLTLHVSDHLTGSDQKLAIMFKPTCLADFGPGTVAAQVPELAALLAERARLTTVRSDPLADAQTRGLGAVRIALLDELLSRQVDAILHAPEFQALEARWRGLLLLTSQADHGDNQRIELLDVSRSELLEDFEDAPELRQSGLYRLVYSAEYGQFGGEPYAAMIADYEFGPGSSDLALLQKLAALGAMAHAPILAAASPRFFGLAGFDKLAALVDPAGATALHAGWNAFRATDEARNVGLTLPRILLRTPWNAGEALTAWPYREETGATPHARLWGSAAFAVATRLCASFAQHRWCSHLVGVHDGTITGLPHEMPAVGGQVMAPVETQIGERLDGQLAELGFIPLVARPASGEVSCYSAGSCQKARDFGPGTAGATAALNHRLGTQLPYLLLINRLAHYLKILQRERIGTWKERADLERELDQWLGRYVVDMDEPGDEIRNAHPLRDARVRVEDVPGDAGWYRVAIAVRPHLKHLGASFTLSLVGRLDRERG
jgi:type VI secretion system protein ImpC